MSVFTTIQVDAYNAIRVAPLFLADAATTIFKDYGNVKKAVEWSLDITNNVDARGFAVSVWPPAAGSSPDASASGNNSVNNTIVVSFQVNPLIFAQQAVQGKVQGVGGEVVQGVGGEDINELVANPIEDAAEWVGCRMDAIIKAVLGIKAQAGGVKFQLAEHCYALTSFDEGLIEYHLRFVRHLPMGL